MRHFAILATTLVLLVPVGCTDDDDGPTGDPDVEDTTQAGFDDFIASKVFEDWTSDPEPREPIPGSGSPHGLVRTYFGPALQDSLEDFDGAHPVGAAALKVAYSDADTISHYFMYVKHADDGDFADNFTWYRQDTSTFFVGAGFCGDCHGATEDNQDGTLTPLP